jgi:hypothetical protein
MMLLMSKVGGLSIVLDAVSRCTQRVQEVKETMATEFKSPRVLFKNKL